MLIALDVGLARIGVAVQVEGTTFSGHKEIIHLKESDYRTYLLQLIEKFKPEKVVLGLPLVNGELHDTEVTRFIKEIELFLLDSGVDVGFWGEEYTTRMAKNLANQLNLKKTKRTKKGTYKKSYHDDVAASIILQNYLEYEKNNS